MSNNADKLSTESSIFNYLKKIASDDQELERYLDDNYAYNFADAIISELDSAAWLPNIYAEPSVQGGSGCVYYYSDDGKTARVDYNEDCVTIETMFLEATTIEQFKQKYVDYVTNLDYRDIKDNGE